MPLQIQGNGLVVAEVDGTTFRALRTTVRPIDHGALGSYKVSATTGSMAAGLAGSSPIFYLRWTDATRLAVITNLVLDGIYTTTAFAVGQILLRATMARSFTAENGTPGGTALTLTGNNQKLRTSMGTSLMAVARIATTAALGAPTWTLDSQDVGQINSHSSAGVGAATPIIGNVYVPKLPLIDPDVSSGEHPIVLAQNEGIVIRATVPATGVWIAGITARWTEVAAF